MKRLIRALFVVFLSASLVVGCFSSGSTSQREQALDGATGDQSIARGASAEALVSELDDNAVRSRTTNDDEQHEDRFVQVIDYNSDDVKKVVTLNFTQFAELS